MNSSTFWNQISNIAKEGFTPEGLFINDFHRQNSMAALREVRLMSLQPCSREQKLKQIQSIQSNKTSKESANRLRNKLKP